MGKRVPQTGLIGQMGINLIERVVLEMGHLWYPTPGLEAGIDGRIELRNRSTGEALNTIVLVQSKATAIRFQGETSTSLEYLCSPADLEYWLRGNAPVIVVVSRPHTGDAYWVSIKDYFADPKVRRSRKVLFDKQKDRFDVNCGDALMAIAMPRRYAPYLAPLPRPEQLLTNLLPVSRLPAQLYLADTSIRDPLDAWRTLRQETEDARGGWVLYESKVLSVHNLEEPPWTSLCDRGTVEAFDVDEWASGADADRSRLFVQLLNLVVRDSLPPFLRYNGLHGLYYFRATPDLRPREYRCIDSRDKQMRRTVFQALYRSGSVVSDSGKGQPAVDCYRHWASAARFRRFGDVWYLEVIPTYLFTRDGYEPFRFSAERLSGIKRLEHNDAVRRQLEVWAACLSSDVLGPTNEWLRCGRALATDLEVGLDDAAWRTASADSDLEFDEAEHEDADSPQLTLF